MREQDIESEDDFQSALKRKFENCGWRVKREVFTLDSKGRADLIVEHEDYGWFGIETKYIGMGGGKLADAHHQIISKYRKSEFRTAGYPEISCWVFSPYFYYYDSDDNFMGKKSRTLKTFTREFFNRHGVGFLDPHSSRLRLDFNNSDREMKVPLDDKKADPPNMEKIKSMIDKKIGEFTYEKESEKTCQYDSTGQGCDATAEETIGFQGFKLHLCRHHVRKFDMEVGELMSA